MSGDLDSAKWKMFVSNWPQYALTVASVIVVAFAMGVVVGARNERMEEKPQESSLFSRTRQHQKPSRQKRYSDHPLAVSPPQPDRDSPIHHRSRFRVVPHSRSIGSTSTRRATITTAHASLKCSKPLRSNSSFSKAPRVPVTKKQKRCSLCWQRSTR